MKRAFFTAMSFLLAPLVFSQEALKSIEEDYYDFLSLAGTVARPTLGYRTLSDSVWTFAADEDGASLNGSEAHIWKANNLGTAFTRGIMRFRAYGPEWYNSYNTACPHGQNDGALWQGKGYNTSLTAGARLEAYGLELTVKPQISWSQNKAFELMPSVGKTPYGYYQGGIDLPQRFGDDAIKTFDWGDTEVRYSWHTLTAGFGFQSPWLGPAYINPMLGSNNAATYPKIDAGLRKTAVYMPHFGWKIGDIEGRIWLGRLSESDYFDNNPDNDYRLLTAMSASFSPAFIPHLTLGMNRIFMTRFAARNTKYIGRLFTLSHINGSQVGTHEDEDQKVALFGHWHFPQAGFEAWGEFGLDDFTSDEVSNPFHTAFYSVGAKQITPLPVQWLKGEIIAEWNNFEMSQDFQMQWRYTGYYSHGAINQGYTHKGQILGAGSGSMGNSQFLGYKLYHPRGSILLFFHRYCPDNNYIYNMTVGKAITADSEEYKTYYAQFKTYRTYGISATQYITSNFILSASGTRMFIAHPLYSKPNTTGFSVTLSAKYNF